MSNESPSNESPSPPQNQQPRPTKYSPGDRVLLFGKAMATVVSVGFISLVVKVDKNGSIVQCGYGEVKMPELRKIRRKPHSKARRTQR